MPSNADPSPIRVKGIDHVTLVVQDLGRSRDFYCGILGMEEVERPRFPFGGLWFQAGATQVHLIDAHDRSANPGYPNVHGEMMEGVAHHFAFEVDDADAAAEQLKARDVRIMGGPCDRPDGPRQVWFYDPDGHVVEVFSR